MCYKWDKTFISFERKCLSFTRLFDTTWQYSSARLNSMEHRRFWGESKHVYIDWLHLQDSYLSSACKTQTRKKNENNQTNSSNEGKIMGTKSNEWVNEWMKKKKTVEPAPAEATIKEWTANQTDAMYKGKRNVGFPFLYIRNLADNW